MKAREFILEKVLGTLQLGDIRVEYDDHTDQQKARRDRQVKDSEIDQVLRRIHQVRRPMLALNHGERFWVYDPEVDVALGFTMISPSQRIVRLKTVIHNRPWDSDRLVLTIGDKSPKNTTKHPELMR
jgi:hypothetical protein